MDWHRFANLFRNPIELGRKRFVAPGAARALVFMLISICGHFAARSSFETLYVGPTPPDISRKGSVLSEAGIAFETSLNSTNFSADYRDKGPRHEQY